MPQTYIRNIPPETINERKRLVRAYMSVAQAVWRSVGDGKVTGILLERFWSGADPWVTADYVTASLDGVYSDDTVRRRLKQLVDAGVLLKCREGRLSLYAMRPSMAEEIIKLMEEGLKPADCGQNLISSRNLRENLVVVGPYPTHRGEDTA